MNREPGGLVLRVLFIGAATAALAVLVVGMDALLARRGQAEAAESPAPVFIGERGTPIATEADVFRKRSDELALHADAQGRDGAHRRTLASFRALRAYPGAPPRIPHGLTADEYRNTSCNSCHEHGGFSARFAAYAPVTPHPELTACLQCHVGDDAVVGTALPTADPDAVCRQCHVPGGMTSPIVALDWRPAPWPELDRSGTSAPPPIPHQDHLRGNCVACHAGPSAVAEIRTTHAERANCRQCHVSGGGP